MAPQACHGPSPHLCGRAAPRRSTLQARMAAIAPRDRPVTDQVRRRVAMTTETEIVKARLGADSNLSAAAAMTTDARIAAALIGEVVMT